VGHFLSPAGSDYVKDSVNSALAIFAIWVTAFLSLKRKRAEEERARMEQFAAARERLALLGELAAGIAHEFRNPLDGVLNCVQLLRPIVGEKPSDRELVDMAEEGLRRMDTISARMLRLGREEKGQRLPTVMKEVVDSAVSLIAIRAQKQGVHLAVQVDPDLPLVDLDAERISEALLNLLTNALDACKSGCTITVRGLKVPGSGEAVEIRVIDDGSGIPAEVRSKIFEPFFTTKPVGKGSGLGLAISRKIAEIHGGSLKLLESGQGTTFSILLPVKAAH
jgi:signal transduction histidine kinase